MILLTKQLSRTLKMCWFVFEESKDKMKGISDRVDKTLENVNTPETITPWLWNKCRFDLLPQT